MNIDNKELVSGKYLEYKGKPLVREGDTICYGDMSEKCILILEIMSYKKSGANDIPDKILIQIIDSKDPARSSSRARRTDFTRRSASDASGSTRH